MKKDIPLIILLLLLLLSSIVNTSCITQHNREQKFSELRNAAIGQQKQQVVRAALQIFGPPYQIVSDGIGGEIYVFVTDQGSSGARLENVYMSKSYVTCLLIYIDSKNIVYDLREKKFKSNDSFLLY